MHTVEQAKILWCPMVRHDGDSSSFNRGRVNSNPTNRDTEGSREIDEQECGCHCIGDRCVMWRWGEFRDSVVDEVVDDLSFGPGGKRVAKKTISVPVAGYCGLAGKPVALS